NMHYGNDSVAALSVVPGIKKVYISRCPLSPVDQQALAKYSDLEELYLDGVSIDVDSLVRSHVLEKLKKLCLVRYQNEVQIVEALKDKKNLSALAIIKPGGFVNIEELSKLKSLNSLVLIECGAESDGLASLAKLPHLKELTISNWSVENSMVKTLK